MSPVSTSKNGNAHVADERLPETKQQSKDTSAPHSKAWTSIDLIETPSAKQHSSTARWNFIKIWQLMILYVAFLFMAFSMMKSNNRNIVFMPSYLDGKLYVHVQATGRLGNQMFQYALLYVVANYTHRTPIAGQSFMLKSFFPNLSIPIEPYVHTAGMGELSWATFSPRLFTHLPHSSHVHMCCYFQSWKYFKHFRDYEPDLRAEFTINKTYIEIANKFISIVTTGLKNRNPNQMKDITYVGVHVRRSDYLWEDKIKFGYQTANKSYIDKAMAYFRKKYNPVQFLLASDDVKWCRENLNYTDVAITDKDMFTDFTILTLCNHTIMTVGTFGWWASWLAAGEVIYYDTPARPGSTLSKGYKAKDYFMPDWIGMSD